MAGFEERVAKSMQSLVELLTNDSVVNSYKGEVKYRLSHPSKQMASNNGNIDIFIEPAGWTQVGVAELNLRYWFWVFFKYKPSFEITSARERLTPIMLRVSELVHGKKLGDLNTYLIRSSLNYRSLTFKTSSRDVSFELQEDEIGGCLMFTQSENELQDEDVENE